VSFPGLGIRLAHPRLREKAAEQIVRDGIDAGPEFRVLPEALRNRDVAAPYPRMSG
jgi:hypothetical protein